MNGTKYLTQKLRGTEKTTMYPISLFFKNVESAPFKYLFENFNIKEVRKKKTPSPTVTVREGEKRSYTVEINEPEKLLPSKNKGRLFDEDLSIFNPSNIKITKKSRRKSRIISTKSNKKEGIDYSNTNQYESYKGDIRNMGASIFNAYMTNMVMGVMKNEYICKLPGGMGEISAHDVDKASLYKKIMKSINVTAEQVRYKLQVVQIKYCTKTDPDHWYMKTTLIPTGLYRKYVRENMVSKKQYNAYKIKSARESLNDLAEIYYDVPRDVLRKIVIYGLERLKRISQIGVSINFSKFLGFGKNGTKYFGGFMTSKYRNINPASYNQKKVFRGVARFISRKIKNQRFYGWYYCSLSEYETYNILTHRIKKRLTKSMEEAMLNPYKYPYIVAVKVGRDVNGKARIELLKEITYERGSFKYLWKWDGSRFRAYDNSKLRVNLLSERNDHNV